MKILVVDDLAIIRDPITGALQGAGYEAVGVANGKDAISYLKSNRPDLILLDIQLPDISGLEILRNLRSDPSTAQLPVILLSAEEARDTIMSAAKLGIQGYMLKSQFSMKELLSRVTKYAGKANSGTIPAKNRSVEIPQLLTRDELLKRIDSALSAKAMSGVVGQVISLATSPRTELADLANVVSKDTVLATRVLRAANSAGYKSSKGAVTTISDAIRQVGCNKIRNIAAAVGIFQAMPQTSADGFNPIRCWQHSFAVAQLCEMLATSNGQNCGVAYLVGLCHDLGEIILRTQFSVEYNQIIELEKTSGRPRDELELRMLGMAHGALVRTILRAFGLPEAVRSPIEWFHLDQSRTSLGSPDTLEGILRVAEWYSNGILLASSEMAELNLLTAAQYQSAIGTLDIPLPDTNKLRGEIMALTGMLARLSPQEESELSKPILAGCDKKIWIASSVPLSSLDSISAAFCSLAQGSVKDRLPTTPEISSLDGLVIVAEKSSRETTIAMQPATFPSVPTLRIISAKSEPAEPEILRCPVTLETVYAFCNTLTGSKQIDSTANKAA